LRGGPVGLVAAVTAGVGCGSISILEGREVGKLGDVVAVDGDEAVMRTLLGVFIHETAREDRGHVNRIKRGDFLECTSICVAAVFREASYPCFYQRENKRVDWQQYTKTLRLTREECYSRRSS
jgi:hypothetical protein